MESIEKSQMKCLKMKDRVNEIKNSQDGIKNKLDCADITIKWLQTEAQKEKKRLKTNGQSFGDMWDNIKQSYIPVWRVLEGEALSEFSKS